MKLSFGMIFSIMLIIVFIAFAFFAIGKFLDIQNVAQIGKFTNDFQASIDKIWRGSEGSEVKEYFLPSKIDYVCITDYSKPPTGPYSSFYDELEQVYFEFENLFFYPLGSSQGFDAREMENINLTKTTENKNPVCFENVKGKVSVRIKKNFDEALVTLSE